LRFYRAFNISVVYTLVRSCVCFLLSPLFDASHCSPQQLTDNGFGIVEGLRLEPIQLSVQLSRQVSLNKPAIATPVATFCECKHSQCDNDQI